jgi:hypothetical protein
MIAPIHLGVKSMQRSRFRNLVLIGSLFLWSVPSLAYYTTMDTGRLLKQGEFKLGAEAQFITEGDDGVNLAGRFDGPIDDELGWRAQVGFGTTDVFLAGFVKWVPIPDTENQPAIGVNLGVLYANYESVSELSLRAHPFISKEFHKMDIGQITPYAALPIGIRTVDGDSDVPFQIAIGADFRPDGLEKINFIAEIGFDINDAFPYFAFGATLEFDNENGIEFK